MFKVVNQYTLIVCVYLVIFNTQHRLKCYEMFMSNFLNARIHYKIVVKYKF